MTSNVERAHSSRLSDVDCVASRPTTVQLQHSDGSRFGASVRINSCDYGSASGLRPTTTVHNQCVYLGLLL